MGEAYIQTFHVENSEIKLDEVTQGLYNALTEQGTDYMKQVNEGIWIIDMVSEGVHYYIATSTEKDVVSKFMHGVMFASELLRKENNDV